MKPLFYSLSLIAGLLLLSPSTVDAKRHRRPLMTNISVDLDAGRIFIAGSRFGSAPTVEMGCPDGEKKTLTILSSTDSMIEAALPDEEMYPGTYLIITSNGGKRRAKMDMAIGPHITTEYNTSVGEYALQYNTDEYQNNTAVGTHTLQMNTTGIYNTGVGSRALQDNETGSGNTAIGTSALRHNTAANNTAVGYSALRMNTSGAGNTAMGVSALHHNIEGRSNTALGIFALRDNTDGNNNTATGFLSLENNLSGSSNTATGYFALRNNDTGSGNTAIGALALINNRSGNDNTATGNAALQMNTTGSGLTATGRMALTANTSGINNTATGSGALRRNSEGSHNTAIGRSAMRDNTLGDGNTAMGVSALILNTTGSRNTAVGTSAIFRADGSDNTAIGYHAGFNSMGGSNNIYINNLGATESNTIRIGTDEHLWAYMAGVPIRVPSSKRFKKDIHEMADASSRLMQLRPVTFHYKEQYDATDGALQYGLIAEEVAEVFPHLVVYSKTGTPQTVKYNLLVTLLLNELQKQHRLNQEQAQGLALLTSQTAAMLELNARVAALEATDDGAVPVAVSGSWPATTQLRTH